MAGRNSQIYYCRECREETRHDVTQGASTWINEPVRAFERLRKCIDCGNVICTYEIDESVFGELTGEEVIQNIKEFKEEYELLVEEREKLDKKISGLLRKRIK